MIFKSIKTGGIPGGGHSLEFLVVVGCAARFSKSWPYFRPKNVTFHTV